MMFLLAKLAFSVLRRGLRDRGDILFALCLVTDLVPAIMMLGKFWPRPAASHRTFTMDPCQGVTFMLDNHYGSRDACYMRGHEEEFCERRFLDKVGRTFLGMAEQDRQVCWPKWEHASEIPSHILEQ